MRALVWILLAGLLPAQLFAAPQYIDFKPLDQVIKTPVASVRSGTKVLPLITWGGDIATIYANGSDRSTQPGSLIARQGLSYTLVREDSFANQLKSYMAGETPFLRGTLGMMASAADVLNKDSRTRPVIFYQMTWSSGGDALVVKGSIKSARDLRGKTIAVQAYGPHVDYLVRVLRDAGLSARDVKLKWLPDLTGTDNSPAAALYENDIDAAFVIIPDALALTSGGTVGNGSEDSVKGARILMSTKTASRVIADVYAVRADYYKANPDEIRKLTQALIEGQEQLSQLVSSRTQKASDYRKTMSSAAMLLLDSASALADVEGLYADCEFVGLAGNDKFFNDKNYPRGFAKVDAETRESLKALGLVSGAQKLTQATTNFKQLATGTGGASVVEESRFNRDQVAALVTRKQQQGSLAEGELFSFEVFFSPNQNNFSAELYKTEFNRVIELASTYGGAIITVEGHSDPMGYLRAKKEGEPPVVLGRIKQSAKNLSVSRAQAVRDAVMAYAQSRQIALDETQFEPIGHGISQPASGICGSDPCPPKTEAAWRANMRVLFRIIQVEAESDVFVPL